MVSVSTFCFFPNLTLYLIFPLLRDIRSVCTSNIKHFATHEFPDIKECQDVREMGAWLDKHKKMSFRYSVPFL